MAPAGADACPGQAAPDGHANVRKASDVRGRWPPDGGPGAPRDCHERTLTTTVISFGFSLQLSIRGEIHHGCDGAHLREEVLWVSGAAAI